MSVKHPSPLQKLPQRHTQPTHYILYWSTPLGAPSQAHPHVCISSKMGRKHGRLWHASPNNHQRGIHSAECGLLPLPQPRTARQSMPVLPPVCPSIKVHPKDRHRHALAKYP